MCRKLQPLAPKINQQISLTYKCLSGYGFYLLLCVRLQQIVIHIFSVLACVCKGSGWMDVCLLGPRLMEKAATNTSKLINDASFNVEDTSKLVVPPPDSPVPSSSLLVPSASSLFHSLGRRVERISLSSTSIVVLFKPHSVIVWFGVV